MPNGNVIQTQMHPDIAQQLSALFENVNGLPGCGFVHLLFDALVELLLDRDGAQGRAGRMPGNKSLEQFRGLRGQLFFGDDLADGAPFCGKLAAALTPPPRVLDQHRQYEENDDNDGGADHVHLSGLER